MTRELQVLKDGGHFFEGPRWHDGKWWVSDFYRRLVLTVAPDGTQEEVTTVENQPSGLGWLPDGSLLVVSMRDHKLLRRAPDGTVSEHADEFHRSLPSDPAVLNKIRRDLRVWLTGNRFTPEGTNDVVLAVGEALANAMEHADVPDAGVTLSLARIGRQDVQAVVENDGGWRENPSDPTRGRGLAVMEALSTSLTVDHGRGATRVRMVFTH